MALQLRTVTAEKDTLEEYFKTLKSWKMAMAQTSTMWKEDRVSNKAMSNKAMPKENNSETKCLLRP